MPVAVVTGSNKGLGLGIVKALCQKYQGDVYLTSRDEARGLAAVQDLEKEGLQPKYHQLDINSRESVEGLRDFLQEKYGGLDVLVNNAGMAFKHGATEPFGHQATVTVGTNYWSTKMACDVLFPILRPGARVVNMSSSCGFLGHITDEGKGRDLREKLSSADLTVSQLDQLMTQFVEAANQGTHVEQGWPNSAYKVSKIGVSALSRIQHREMGVDERDDIVVNHVHPGWVDTDMTSHKGPLTVDRGCMSAVYAALLPPGTEVRGEYIWHDCSLVDWVSGPLPPIA